MNESKALPANMPWLETIETQARRFIALWLGAMFLKTESYTYVRNLKNPFGNGLTYIATIGVLTALAGILGTGLRYATSPTLEGIKNTVLVHLQAMPFYEAFSSGVQDSFNRGFETFWGQFGTFLVGYPTNAAGFVTLTLTVLTTPLGLVISWLIYGALVHLVARGWNRETSFGELLAPLALATSPYLLNLLMFLPSGNVSGLVVSLWTFICNVFAIRIAYQTTTRRALWGALFPILLFIVLLVLLLILAIAVVVPLSRTVGGPQ